MNFCLGNLVLEEQAILGWKGLFEVCGYKRVREAQPLIKRETLTAAFSVSDSCPVKPRCALFESVHTCVVSLK